jgi:hypothetical protein
LAAIFVTNSVDCGFSRAKAVQGFSENTGLQHSPAVPARLFQIQSRGIDSRVPLRSRTDFSETGNVAIRMRWLGMEFALPLCCRRNSLKRGNSHIEQLSSPGRLARFSLSVCWLGTQVGMSFLPDK